MPEILGDRHVRIYKTLVVPGTNLPSILMILREPVANKAVKDLRNKMTLSFLHCTQHRMLCRLLD